MRAGEVMRAPVPQRINRPTAETDSALVRKLDRFLLGGADDHDARLAELREGPEVRLRIQVSA